MPAKDAVQGRISCYKCMSSPFHRIPLLLLHALYIFEQLIFATILCRWLKRFLEATKNRLCMIKRSRKRQHAYCVSNHEARKAADSEVIMVNNFDDKLLKDFL